MPPRPVVCSCSKRFGTESAMLQHQRDSSLHVAVPQAQEQIAHVDQRMQGMSLQDQEADHGFVPFAGGGSTTFIALSSDSSRLSQPIMAGVKKPFIAEGSKPKKRKSRKSTSLKIAPGTGSTSKVNPNTGRVMNLLEDQDWVLCDKDCGWCGHCAEGVLY